MSAAKSTTPNLNQSVSNVIQQKLIRFVFVFNLTSIQYCQRMKSFSIGFWIWSWRNSDNSSSARLELLHLPSGLKLLWNKFLAHLSNCLYAKYKILQIPHTFSYQANAVLTSQCDKLFFSWNCFVTQLFISTTVQLPEIVG